MYLQIKRAAQLLSELLTKREFKMCFYKNTILELAGVLNSDDIECKAGDCAIIIEQLAKLDIQALRQQGTCQQSQHGTSPLDTST